MPLTAEAIRAFLASDLGVDVSGIGPDTALFSTSRIDSFALVELLAFIERIAGFRIHPHEVNLDNLDTVSRILAFAASRSS